MDYSSRTTCMRLVLERYDAILFIIVFIGIVDMDPIQRTNSS